MPESYGTPSLFEQDNGVSDSPGAPQIEIPAGPSIAERTGFGTEPSDHHRTHVPDVHTETVGHIPPGGHVETNPDVRATQATLVRRREGGDPEALARIEELRKVSAAHRPEEPAKKPAPREGEIDHTLFMQDVQPERTIPNQPPAAPKTEVDSPQPIYPQFKQPPSPPKPEGTSDVGPHHGMRDSRRILEEGHEDF